MMAIVKMRLLNFFLLFINFYGLCYLHQVLGATGMVPPKPRDLRDLINLKALTTPKQNFRLPSLTPPRKILLQKPNFVQSGSQLQRRDVPFQQTFLGVPVEIEKVKQTQPALPIPNLYTQLPKLPPVKPLIKPNETEAERAERIHKSFERLLTFVEIVGQVDNYVSSKWKNLVKTVSNFYETEDEPLRVSSRRVYTCPHAH